MKKNYVVAITGASGSILALKLIKWLLNKEYHVDILVSSFAYKTMGFEIASYLSNTKGIEGYFKDIRKGQFEVFNVYNTESPPCSGAYQHSGMIIVPCSMATISAVSIGFADNAIRRSADVTIKEKRKLIVVPREAPFSVIHLENLLKLAKIGVVVLPPTPQWYLKLKSLEEIENAIVGRILDSLGESHDLYIPWSGFTN